MIINVFRLAALTVAAGLAIFFLRPRSFRCWLCKWPNQTSTNGRILLCSRCGIENTWQKGSGGMPPVPASL